MPMCRGHHFHYSPQVGVSITADVQKVAVSGRGGLVLGGPTCWPPSPWLVISVPRPPGQGVLGGSRDTRSSPGPGQAPSPAHPQPVEQCAQLWGGQMRETPAHKWSQGCCLELARPVCESSRAFQGAARPITPHLFALRPARRSPSLTTSQGERESECQRLPASLGGLRPSPLLGLHLLRPGVQAGGLRPTTHLVRE